MLSRSLVLHYLHQQTRSRNVSLSTLAKSKPSRPQKAQSPKKVERHGDVKVCAQHHSICVAGNAVAKVSASRTSFVKLSACDQGPRSNGDANTFESELSRDAEFITHSQDLKDHYSHQGGEAPSLDWSALSGCETSDSCDFSPTSKGNDTLVLASTLADLSASSQPLPKAVKSITKKNSLQIELLRKVKLLEQLSPNVAASLLQKRAFKECSFEKLETVLQLLKELLVSNESVSKVLVRNWRVLSRPIDLLREKLNVLAHFQIDKATVVRICSFMSVLGMSVETLRKKLGVFEEIGLSVEARNKVLCRNPNVLRLSRENWIKILEFLKSVGVTRERALSLIVTYPHLLGLSCDNNLIPRYKYYEQMGISTHTIPSIICSSSRTPVDTLKAHMELVKDLGFSDNDVCLMVRKHPSILARDPKTIKMILDYLVHEQKWSVAEIVHFPRSLGCSLQQRIIPRCKLLEERGLSKVYSLATTLGYSDSRFNDLLEKRKRRIK